MNVNDSTKGQYNEYSEVMFVNVISNVPFIGNEADAERECFVTEGGDIKRKLKNIDG
jgi:hypothetical protein